MNTSLPQTAVPEAEIRIMLVDDSTVIRSMIARTLEEDPAIKIVSSVCNGKLAVDSVARAQPDIVVLDIEMPVMDGLTALPMILEKKPDAKVLICSTLSKKGADISLKALSLGATDYLVKPSSTRESNNIDSFKRELRRLVKGLAGKRQLMSAPAAEQGAKKTQTIALREDTAVYNGQPEIIAIGSSTGGPKALPEVIKFLKGLDVPIVITQHMPKTFTSILAQHLEAGCALPCFEGEEGMAVEKGKVYIAPGGLHMGLAREGNKVVIYIDDGPQENYCKPSVDFMMRSVIKVYGKRTLGVMLTGMGKDGLDGFRSLAEKGGRIIAQDKQTSVVWGMPGAVAEAGLCTAILPLQKIGPHICKRFAKEGQP